MVYPSALPALYFESPKPELTRAPLLASRRSSRCNASAKKPQQPVITGLRFRSHRLIPPPPGWRPHSRPSCTDSPRCFSPWPGRPSSASPGRPSARRPGPASPRSSGRAGGCCTTTAPAGTTGPPSPTTARTRGSGSCSSTRDTPRARSKAHSSRLRKAWAAKWWKCFYSSTVDESTFDFNFKFIYFEGGGGRLWTIWRLFYCLLAAEFVVQIKKAHSCISVWSTESVEHCILMLIQFAVLCLGLRIFTFCIFYSSTFIWRFVVMRYLFKIFNFFFFLIYF